MAHQSLCPCRLSLLVPNQGAAAGAGTFLGPLLPFFFNLAIAGPMTPFFFLLDTPELADADGGVSDEGVAAAGVSAEEVEDVVALLAFPLPVAALYSAKAKEAESTRDRQFDSRVVFEGRRRTTVFRAEQAVDLHVQSFGLRVLLILRQSLSEAHLLGELEEAGLRLVRELREERGEWSATVHVNQS